MVNFQEWLNENYPMSSRFNVEHLDISNKGLVGTLTLEGFNNIKSVDASFNKLENFYVPVTDAPFLEEINLSNNSLKHINIERGNVWKKLWINDNKLKKIDTNYLNNLEYLNICNNNSIDKIDTSNLSNLKNFYCSCLNLTEIDTEPLVNLTYLDVSVNHISDLNTKPLKNLEYLQCSANQLTKLDTTHLTNLVHLYAYFNQITDIDVKPLKNISFFYFTLNPLTNPIDENDFGPRIITFVYTHGDAEVKKNYPGKIEPILKIKTRKELESELEEKRQLIKSWMERVRQLSKEKEGELNSLKEDKVLSESKKNLLIEEIDQLKNEIQVLEVSLRQKEQELKEKEKELERKLKEQKNPQNQPTQGNNSFLKTLLVSLGIVGGGGV